MAVLVSWGIAFFEYLLQVPANRIGFGQMTLPQLKMLQEVITLACSCRFRSGTCTSQCGLDFSLGGDLPVRSGVTSCSAAWR